MVFGKSKQQVLEGILKKMNAAWQQGNVTELARYFHQDMVIVDATMQPKYTGRDACIRHLQEFASFVKIESFKDGDYIVLSWDDNTAIASYSFEVVFSAGGQTQREAGRELYAFVYRNGAWLAVWNAVQARTNETAATTEVGQNATGNSA